MPHQPAPAATSTWTDAPARRVRAAFDRVVDDACFLALLDLADARPELAWPEGRDIALARAAHATNSPAELAAALAADHDWLEGDVRVGRDGRIIMAHNAGAPSVLTLDEWLAVGMRSGRGLKLDFKDAAAIVPAVERAAELGVPPSRFIINVTVQGERSAVVGLDQLRAVREHYPTALVNISACTGSYCDRTLERMARWARATRGPAMFPLRLDIVTPDVVRRLQPHGRVAIWNEPAISSPACIERATTRLRALGVDGMIDLRHAIAAERIARPLVRLSIRVFGWNATIAMRNLGAHARGLRVAGGAT